ncbi:MAG TPA: hypothetical protein VN328_11450 [Thermodesulfovibrionales bacterium]|nr:hypothetical protein [Thermodesulfovibrionales bacterium]
MTGPGFIVYDLSEGRVTNSDLLLIPIPEQNCYFGRGKPWLQAESRGEMYFLKPSFSRSDIIVSSTISIKYALPPV